MNFNRHTNSVARLAFLIALSLDVSTLARDESEATIEPVSVPVATAVNVLSDPTQPLSDVATLGQGEEESAAKTLSEEFQLPLEKHLWTKFLPGAWREVEITTEVFNQAGESLGQSITMQREQLQSIAEDSYLLQISATVDHIEGSAESAPNTRALKILTDNGGQVFQTQHKQDQLLQLGTTAISTKVWDVVFNDESQNLRQRLYYSPDVFPYILKRELSENDDDAPVEQIPLETAEVFAREIPYSFQGRRIPCVGVHIVRRHPKGCTEILQFLHRDIPGGEVICWSTDFDSQERRIRWTVRETSRYGSVNDNLSQQTPSHNSSSIP